MIAANPASNQLGATANAPSVTLPLRFILASLVALVLGVIALALRPDVLATYHYNQYVISITHLFVLGWIATVVMGSVYQLVPVALETRLYSERLAAIQFVLQVIGVAGMVWMFWTWNLKQVGHFGSVFAAGVALFIYNIGRTLFRVPRWNVVAAGVASSLFWLGTTVLLGLAIAAGKCSYEATDAGQQSAAYAWLLKAMAAVPSFMARFDAIATMHAHAHAGVAGVFLILIVGVSYRLVPMFTLSEVQSRARAAASLILLNAGLAGVFVTVALRSPLKPGFAGLMAAGLVVFGWEIRAILRARKRRGLDWGVKYFLTALTLLGLLAPVGLVLSWPSLPLTQFTGQLENAYGTLAILGVVSLAIMGMLYKIIPFIVWYSCYSRHVGLRKVPALADLYSPPVQKAGYWLFLGGLGVMTMGTVLGSLLLTRCGALLLGGAISALITNCWLMLSHWFSPRLEDALPVNRGAPSRPTNGTTAAVLNRQSAGLVARKLTHSTPKL